MKRILLVLTVIVSFSAFSASAQSIGYINTETILSAMVEYQQAQSALESLSKKYKEALESEAKELEGKFNAYQAKKNSLSASSRTQLENEIITKERELKEKESLYFGADGILANKSEELIKPIQLKVQAAIDVVSSMNGKKVYKIK